MLRTVLTGLLAMALCSGCHPAASPSPRGTHPEGSGGVNAPVHRDAPHVVVVSLDGFRPDYVDRYGGAAFERFVRDGARAERMIPTFPTKTYPTHYSVATGMYAEHHRLVANTFWDPERGERYAIGDRETVEDGSWYGGEPIWVTAEAQGMVSAAFFFIGTEAAVGGVYPTYWNRYDGSIANETRVEQVIEWLSMPDETRPHLITMYFSDLDDAGHDTGPDGAEVHDAVTRVDRQLGRLLEGIDALPHGENIYVLVLADHGMLRAEADRAYPVDLTRLPGVRMIEAGPYASFFVDDPAPERVAEVRDSLRTMLPEARVWTRGEIPARLHYSSDPRIGDILALSDPGATITRGDWVPTEDDFTHGWDNQIAEMGAVFLALGPGIDGGTTIPAFESIHVYPWIASVLGLTPNPAIDGRLEVLLPYLGGAS